MRLVLASGSPYRATLLARHGIEARIDPPDVDERALDGLLATDGPEALALALAHRKAEAVAPRHPGALVLAADQVGLLDGSSGPELLTKQPSVEGAVAQLLRMSDRTHRLVNGLVVLDASAGRAATGVDVQRVTFRPVGEDEARAYVERFRPFDTAGSYRLEDQDAMAPGQGFVGSVEGEDPSGVLGLPLPLLDRLLAEVVTPRR